MPPAIPPSSTALMLSAQYIPIRSPNSDCRRPAASASYRYASSFPERNASPAAQMLYDTVSSPKSPANANSTTPTASSPRPAANVSRRPNRSANAPDGTSAASLTSQNSPSINPT